MQNLRPGWRAEPCSCVEERGGGESQQGRRSECTRRGSRLPRVARPPARGPCPAAGASLGCGSHTGRGRERPAQPRRQPASRRFSFAFRCHTCMYISDGEKQPHKRRGDAVTGRSAVTRSVQLTVQAPRCPAARFPSHHHARGSGVPLSQPPGPLLGCAGDPTGGPPRGNHDWLQNSCHVLQSPIPGWRLP